MRPPNSPDTITDETRDSHNTFDTKFWDSFDVMLSCVFCWSQYLRVLILSCLSCSTVVIMVITSTQTDRQSIYGVCHEWLNGALHGLRGLSAQTHCHIRPHGNFMLSDAPVCLPSSCLSSVMIVLINEWWIINRQSSIISPWLPHRNWCSFVLVERCICVCGSWCTLDGDCPDVGTSKILKGTTVCLYFPCCHTFRIFCLSFDNRTVQFQSTVCTLMHRVPLSL